MERLDLDRLNAHIAATVDDLRLVLVDGFNWATLDGDGLTFRARGQSGRVVTIQVSAGGDRRLIDVDLEALEATLGNGEVFQRKRGRPSNAGTQEVTFRIFDDQAEWLRAQPVPMSEEVRDAIDAWIARGQDWPE